MNAGHSPDMALALAEVCAFLAMGVRAGHSPAPLSLPLSVYTQT